MQRRITAKWRPPLAWVLGCTLAAVLCLPVMGIVGVRYLYPVLGYREAVLAVSICVVIIAAYVGWVLYRILLRPITALAGHATRVRKGQGGAEPLDHYGTREMQALGAAMLEMSDTLQNREAVLRTYADHVTHELKSPLTAIRGASELLAMGELPQAEKDRLLANVNGAVARMGALLDAQRSLAKVPEVIAPGVSDLAEVAVPDGVAVSGGQVPLPMGVLQPVLDHLIGNALAHGATQVWVAADGDTLVVSDDGPGISEGNLDRVFDPYFTTRREGGGTGMGLAIVRRLLETQGAKVTVQPGPGARFEIRF